MKSNSNLSAFLLMKLFAVALIAHSAHAQATSQPRKVMCGACPAKQGGRAPAGIPDQAEYGAVLVGGVAILL
jgi:hypothetical protein